jgi:hypothetical protein
VGLFLDNEKILGTFRQKNQNYATYEQGQQVASKEVRPIVFVA